MTNFIEANLLEEGYRIAICINDISTVTARQNGNGSIVTYRGIAGCESTLSQSYDEVITAIKDAALANHPSAVTLGK